MTKNTRVISSEYVDELKQDLVELDICINRSERTVTMSKHEKKLILKILATSRIE